MVAIKLFLLAIGLIFLCGVVNATELEKTKSLIISHKSTEDPGLIKDAVMRIHKSLITDKEKDERLEMLDQLLEHDLGRQIFFDQGLNGLTTQRVIEGSQAETNPVMDWFFNKAPTVLATRERFGIFQIELQKRLRDNVSFCSVPCGTAKDLLGLDLANFNGVSLRGFSHRHRSRWKFFSLGNR